MVEFICGLSRGQGRLPRVVPSKLSDEEGAGGRKPEREDGLFQAPKSP